MWLLISFVVSTAFAVWIVFFGGAEELEGTIASAFLIDIFAPLLTVPLLKAYVIIAWVGHAIALLLRVYS
jgi:hypothetical protein